MADEEEAPQGSMRFQDETTRPREPTLGERKAREQAEKRRAAEQEAAEEARAEEETRGRRKRKRILIGTGATVGVAAVIAAGYGLSQAGDDDVTARCVDDKGVVVADSNCVTPAASGTYHSGGGLYPIFIGGGGRQYHYYYGGSGNPGQVAFGGSTSTPRDSTRVSTPSGKTVSDGSSAASSGSKARSGSSGSVSRGGLGSSSSGSSSGS